MLNANAVAAIAGAYNNHANLVAYGTRLRYLIDNYHDLKLFAEEIGAVKFSVYLFDVQSGEVADCRAVCITVGVENMIKWLMENNIYSPDTKAYNIDMYNTDGDMVTLYDVIC